MSTAFEPHKIEQKWSKLWEQEGYFAPQGKGEPFTIMIPPPNVTGSLHMGHGFNNTVIDVLVRFKRMQGRRVLWQMGTDHAGIATQMLVENQLAAQNIKRHDLGREQFLAKVWQWKEQSGGTICQQIRRLGSSVDWSRERFTMDDGLSQAVIEAFVRLYEDGLIYRGKRLVNWDPKLHTAISDLEVENHDVQGSLWHIKYPLAHDPSQFVVVATTRPETMLGDCAIAVNPKDPRYLNLIGKMVQLPLCNRNIPIIADNYCDMEFGTGCVKITPAHDFNDYEVGMRHSLPLINVFDKNAHILAKAEVFNADLTIQIPHKYAGLERFAVRKLLVQDLDTQGFLLKVEPHALKVPKGDRSGVIIEPYLTDQWYVSTKTLANNAINAVTTEQIKFVPKQYENMYFAWMKDIKDWCISRQLWWGHRIPAWFDADGNFYVGRNEDEVRAKYNLKDTKLKQDEDVLDTWFSSGLWTFSTLGWPQNTADLQTFHPTNVLVTGFDIIFFWVARMIMLSLHLTAQIPFKTVYVHGLVRDASGQKMSKSKGNVLDPLDVIDGISLDNLLEKRTQALMLPKQKQAIIKQTKQEFANGIASHGTDALRFTFCALASTGRDIKFDMGRVEGFANFCNKLWNATNFVFENCQNFDLSTSKNYQTQDLWILSELNNATQMVTSHLDDLRFDLAAASIYEFIWDKFCAWYLELAKPILWDETANSACVNAVRYTLLTVLEQSLRLLHPFMPFITEELWQKIAPILGIKGATIMLQAYPTFNHDLQATNEVNQQINWLQNFIYAVRNIRGELNISPARKFDVLVFNHNADDLAQITKFEPLLTKVAKLNAIMPITTKPLELTSAALVGEMQLLVKVAEFIDKNAEIARLNKEISKIEQEIERINLKLNKASFIDKAPQQVVAKEQAKLANMQTKLNDLTNQKNTINNL